jgi:sirohydrochlorin cobaltochelatase
MNETQKRAVVLVGHGGPATDIPREKIEKLKRLEGLRRKQRLPKMGYEEAQLDAEVRRWPRTPKTDPYKYGLEDIVKRLRERMPDAEVVAAYNEFCAPSIDDAVASLVHRGCRDITLVTTMVTRGGSHSECEIPFEVGLLQKRFPEADIRYAWPFDEAMFADFIVRHLEESRCTSTA